MNPIKRQYIFLLVLSIISFAVRFLILGNHWINPDEGAHLMDAVLALDGKIPIIDYRSRQPLYIYSLAGTLHIFGLHYISGRLLPLFCSFMIGINVFLLGKVLFDKQTAIIGSLIYFLLPLEFMNSLIIKTEPLSTLLTCISVLALSIFFRRNNSTWIVLSGITSALCFYVRQSAVIIPVLAVIFMCFIVPKSRSSEMTKPLLFYLISYIATVSVIVGFYFSIAGFNQKLLTELNPFGFVFITIKKGFSMTTGMFDPGLEISTANGVERFPLRFPFFWRNIKDALTMHLFLILGAVLVFMSVIRKRLKIPSKKSKEMNVACGILFTWLLLLGCSYSFFLYLKGFHIDYFREFLPPLSLLFAVWVRSVVIKDAIHEHLVAWLWACLGVLLCLISLNVLFPKAFSRGAVTGVGVALFVLAYYTSSVIVNRKKVFVLCVVVLTSAIILSSAFQTPLYFSGKVTRLVLLSAVVLLPGLFVRVPRGEYLKVFLTPMVCSVVAGAIVFSMSASMKIVNWSYSAPWPPASLDDTAAFLKAHTSSNDRVMSGAVIWEVQSNRRPYLSISHPLELTKKINKTQLKELEKNIKSNGPEVIILDGYTEKTYLRQIPWLRVYIDAHYLMVHRSEGGKYPVEIYLKKKSLAKKSA